MKNEKENISERSDVENCTLAKFAGDIEYCKQVFNV